MACNGRNRPSCGDCLTNRHHRSIEVCRVGSGETAGWQAAESRLRTLLALADATRVSFYPQVTLTGGVGTGGSEFAELLQNPVGTLAATLAAPFVQVNQARFSTALARNDYEAASVVFRATLMQALYEVENALSRRKQLTEEAGWLEKSLDSARQIERLHEARYRNGTVALQLWLDSQESRRQAELALAGNRLARLQNFTALCRALGGGANTLP